MKTPEQKEFEALAIRAISVYAKLYPTNHYETIFTIFMINKELYYDILCDGLYTMSEESNAKSLWVAPFGFMYLSVEPKSCEHQLLLAADDVPSFEEDIKELLNLFYQRLRGLVDEASDILCSNDSLKP